MPPDRSTFNFNYSNYPYADDPFYIANPALLHSSGWTNAGTFRDPKRYLQEKISNNVDVSYYLNWMGEHALKAGIGYAYLHEDVFNSSTHPRVYMGFGRTTYALGFPVGVGADPSSPNYGAYGYYYVRGSWTQPINGGAWNIHANNWSLYAQDSWTIKNRLTINFGLRADSQYIPSMTTDTSYTNFTDKPVKFDLGQMLAPRLGAVYDVFGDSSLKVFGSFGIYYDVMKLYMAELTFGGWKRNAGLLLPHDPGLDADRGERQLRRPGQPVSWRNVRRIPRFPAAFVRPGRSGPETDRPEGDLLRRREEAAGGPFPFRPLRQ